MGIVELAAIISAFVVVLGTIVGVVFWLSRVDNKAQNAVDELEAIHTKVDSLRSAEVAMARLEGKLDATLAAFTVSLQELREEVRSFKWGRIS